eukprot:8861196-Lingulodinium_polyedra.AAC.1
MPAHKPRQRRNKTRASTKTNGAGQGIPNPPPRGARRWERKRPCQHQERRTQGSLSLHAPTERVRPSPGAPWPAL